jgi:hypothetical protein
VLFHGQTGQVVGERPYGLGAIGEAGKSGIESISDFFHDKIKELRSKK